MTKRRDKDKWEKDKDVSKGLLFTRRGSQAVLVSTSSRQHHLTRPHEKLKVVTKRTFTRRGQLPVRWFRDDSPNTWDDNISWTWHENTEQLDQTKSEFPSCASPSHRLGTEQDISRLAGLTLCQTQDKYKGVVHYLRGGGLANNAGVMVCFRQTSPASLLLPGVNNPTI